MQTEFDSIKRRISEIASRGVDDASSADLKAEINYFNSHVKERVRELEANNTRLLDTIEMLNVENKDKQTTYKELDKLYQSNKNLGSGLETSLKDSRTTYMSIFKNIIVKDSVLIGLMFYIASVSKSQQ